MQFPIYIYTYLFHADGAVLYNYFPLIYCVNDPPFCTCIICITRSMKGNRTTPVNSVGNFSLQAYHFMSKTLSKCCKTWFVPCVLHPFFFHHHLPRYASRCRTSIPAKQSLPPLLLHPDFEEDTKPTEKFEERPPRSDNFVKVHDCLPQICLDRCNQHLSILSSYTQPNRFSPRPWRLTSSSFCTTPGPKISGQSN